MYDVLQEYANEPFYLCTLNRGIRRARLVGSCWRLVGFVLSPHVESVPPNSVGSSHCVYLGAGNEGRPLLHRAQICASPSLGA